MTLLSIDSLCAGYGPIRVLHDLSFSVEPGQKVGILGPTGSGKSSLVSLIPRF